MTAPEPRSSGTGSTGLAAVVVLLTVLAVVVGSREWPAPRRITSGWQVADVPQSLLVLLVVSALVCLAVAAVLARPHRLGAATASAWCGLAVVSAFALVWNDLYLAALGDEGPIIPVFAWAFTFLPTLLVGLVARRGGPVAHRRATLGLAVLVLPLFALGRPLADSDHDLGTVVDGLYTAALFGGVPFLIAWAVTRAPRTRGAAPSPA
ncbi:hypothetical protein [Modestobacter italicus]|uniref:hypothetical protein n=1 Tax=Modestobacter italicus (strain DSM 44449 / CECT 9708 / BC 501) TaxID=2732864 RepID=UPI001C93E814|nr:hypothetical protein [Modestobacter italicus]